MGSKKPVKFTTCRKYKGIEADVIITVDMNKELFDESGKQLYYVGASRARYKLALVANLSEADSNDLIKQMDIRKTKKMGKAIAAAFNAKYTVQIITRERMKNDKSFYSNRRRIYQIYYEK